MKRYQIRIKYSAIRTWIVQAESEKQAEALARSKAELYHLPLGSLTQWTRHDKLRTLSIHEQHKGITSEQVAIVLEKTQFDKALQQTNERHGGALKKLADK